MRLNGFTRALLATAAALTFSGTPAMAQELAPPPTIGAGAARPVWLAARGSRTALNVTASTLLGGAGPHQVATVCVITSGTTPGAVNDSATTAGAAIANQVAAIPNTVGCYPLDWPMFAGLVVVPGTGQAVSVAFN